jgi:4'-phosphopantetheinyl transferase EntD
LTAIKPATLNQAEVHVWSCRLDAAPDAIAYCTTLLAEDEKIRAARFRDSTDRDRFIVAHALLRRLVATYLETHPARLLFGQAAYGKPFLINHPELCFSLSHSGDFALVALARREVGVDVERLDRQIEIDGVAFRLSALGSGAHAGADRTPCRIFSPLDAQGGLCQGAWRRFAAFNAQLLGFEPRRRR